MPLTMIKTGESGQIKRIGGKPETKKFLENLGFTQGASVTVVNQIAGNVIVAIKESRIAISREMANKITV